MMKDGALAIDLDDEIQAGVVITHDGKVVQPATAPLLENPQTMEAPDVDGTGY